jgi:hypothetical protein
VTLAELFDVDTVGAVVVVVVAAVLGVVVADVAPVVDDELDEVELEDVDEELVELVAGVVDELVVVVFFALTVAPPAWAASPANKPVPARAPASDHRVMCLIRRRPASRSALVRGGRGEVLMALIVVPGHVRALAGR